MNRQMLLTRGPGKPAAGQDVEVYMKYRLAGSGAVVDDQAVSFCIQAFLIGDFFCRKEEMADELAVGFRHTVDFRDMPFGND